MTDPERAYMVLGYAGLVLFAWTLAYFGLTRRRDKW
jgi:hypothetical protein